eukprot:Opistho-2@747
MLNYRLEGVVGPAVVEVVAQTRHKQRKYLHVGQVPREIGVLNHAKDNVRHIECVVPVVIRDIAVVFPHGKQKAAETVVWNPELLDEIELHEHAHGRENGAVAHKLARIEPVVVELELLCRGNFCSGNLVKLFWRASRMIREHLQSHLVPRHGLEHIFVKHDVLDAKAAVNSKRGKQLLVVKVKLLASNLVHELHNSNDLHVLVVYGHAQHTLRVETRLLIDVAVEAVVGVGVLNVQRLPGFRNVSSDTLSDGESNLLCRRFLLDLILRRVHVKHRGIQLICRPIDHEKRAPLGTHELCGVSHNLRDERNHVHLLKDRLGKSEQNFTALASRHRQLKQLRVADANPAKLKICLENALVVLVKRSIAAVLVHDLRSANDLATRKLDWHAEKAASSIPRLLVNLLVETRV